MSDAQPAVAEAEVVAPAPAAEAEVAAPAPAAEAEVAAPAPAANAGEPPRKRKKRGFSKNTAPDTTQTEPSAEGLPTLTPAQQECLAAAKGYALLQSVEYKNLKFEVSTAVAQSNVPRIMPGQGILPRPGMMMPGMPGGMPMMMMPGGMPMMMPGMMMPGMPMPMYPPRAVPSSSFSQKGNFRPHGGMPQDGEVLTGVVKSFVAGKGYGFLTHPGVPMDLYFKCEEPVDAGMQVTFTMKWLKDGKPQGRDVHIAVALDEGATVAGVIKSLSDKHGYGFISSGECPQDIYFKKSDLPAELQELASDDIQGTQVSVQIKLQKDGKPCAREIAAISGAPRKLSRKHSGRKRSARPSDGGGLEPAAKRARSVFAPGAVVADGPGEPAEGEIKSYNSQKGWGFISSPSADCDVYFKVKSLPLEMREHEALLIGTQVVFEMRFTADGKPQASNIEAASLMEAADDGQAADAGQGAYLGQEAYAGQESIDAADV